MKTLLAALLLVGCASEPDVTEPLLSETTNELAFDLVDSAGDGAFTIDVQAGTITGHRFQLIDAGVLCRRAATVTAMGERMAALHAELEATTLLTLGEDSCAAAQAGCGGAFDHDLGVSVDSGPRYSPATTCRVLQESGALETSLLAAFDAAAGPSELVEWNGEGYDTLGACPQ